MNGCNNCSKRRDIRKECPWGGTYHHRGEDGEHIGICNAYKQETNADHIQAMSDEELAAYFATMFCHGYGQPQLLSWLRQPWEGDA